jgi:hypothetical protein
MAVSDCAKADALANENDETATKHVIVLNPRISSSRVLILSL